MLQRPSNVLLLDEPTNDLDLQTLQALESALVEFAGSCIVVTHDRYFLDKIATAILVLEPGPRGGDGDALRRKLRDLPQLAGAV